jgi:hypothetical protein
VTIQGARKIKNFTVETCVQDGGQEQANDIGTLSVVWALVYVPEGMTDNPGHINYSAIDAGSTTSLYAPEQHTILSRVTGPLNSTRSFTPVSRLLNSNDRVMLLFRTVGVGKVEFWAHVSYLVSFG